MNPGWLILSAIVGGLIGIGGAWFIEFRKRKQFKEDFKEGMFAELKEALPRLVAYYVDKNLDNKSLNWAKSILLKLKENSIGSEKEHIDEEIECLQTLVKNRRSHWGAPQRFALSLLKESITSISILKPELRHYILKIRSNLNNINNFIEYCISSYLKISSNENANIREQDIEDSLKRLAKISYETAELINKIIFE